MGGRAKVRWKTCVAVALVDSARSEKLQDVGLKEKDSWPRIPFKQELEQVSFGKGITGSEMRYQDVS